MYAIPRARRMMEISMQIYIKILYSFGDGAGEHSIYGDDGRKAWRAK